jgi:hypothetical protein
VLDFGHTKVSVSAISSSRIVRFSTFEVNLHTGKLRQRGQKVKLQEQPLQLLAALRITLTEINLVSGPVTKSTTWFRHPVVPSESSVVPNDSLL